MSRSVLNETPRITRFSEFADKATEHEYTEDNVRISMPSIKGVLLFFALMCFGFCFSDLLLIKNHKVLLIILLTRSSFTLVAAGLYLFVDKIKNTATIPRLILAVELLYVGAFMNIYRVLEKPDYFLNALGLIIIIVAIFLSLDKPKWCAAAALLSLAAFLLLSVIILPESMIKTILSGGFYLAAIIFIMELFALNINYYKRVQYINNKNLELLSTVDIVTGLYNKRKFQSELNRALLELGTKNRPLSVVILDIDDFKQINDRFGHVFGDKVMGEVASVVAASEGGSHIASRWGGDEFAVIFQDMDGERVYSTVERLRVEVAELKVDGVGVTCSFGIAAAKPGDNEITLLARADHMLYEAKRSGKNAVCR